MEVKRVHWIDIAKGITILMVIVSHTVNNHIVRCAIFSFHMPLFFILSGMTYSYSKNISEFVLKLKKSFKRLVIPGIVFYMIVMVVKFTPVYHYIFHDTKQIYPFNINGVYHLVLTMIKTIFWGSGVDVKLSTGVIPAIGIPWFLFVLFGARTILNFIQLKLSDKWVSIVSIFLLIIGLGVQKIHWLPFSFDITLTVIIFIFIGKILKAVDFKAKYIRIFLCSLSIWAITLFLTYGLTLMYLELALRRYTMFPLCYVTAVSGTLCIICFSIMIEKIKVVAYLEFLGRYSLDMLCIHILDSIWRRKLYAAVTNNQYIVIMLIVDILIFTIYELLRKRKIIGERI